MNYFRDEFERINSFVKLQELDYARAASTSMACLDLVRPTELLVVDQAIRAERAFDDRMFRLPEPLFGPALNPSYAAAGLSVGTIGSDTIASIVGAVESARIAGYFDLPEVLQPYRQADHALAVRLAEAYQMPWWREAQAEALNAHSALSEMFDQTHLVGYDVRAAAESVLTWPIPELDTFSQARQFLEVSGLLRFPRLRGLTPREKTQRLKALVKGNTPPTHVRKAHSLIHRYELVLRTIIVQRMEDAYGDDWAIQRLPQCDCKKLLGKRVEHGETVLDHADYTHYANIMSHPEHFETIFSDGFEDVDIVKELIVRAGQLRSRSHHARTFTKEHLQELAITWRTLEAGLANLINDVVFDD